MQGKFDILVITETNADSAFPLNQYNSRLLESLQA